MIKKILFSTFLLVLAPLVQASECKRRVAGVDEGVCPVSLYSLITKGADYDNKVVAVTGFFAYGEIPILFTSRDMFEASSVSDGIAVVLPASVKQVSSLYGLNHSYVELVGRFNARGSDTSDYHGFETAGTITDIKWVSKADHPWGYSEVPPPRLLQGDK